MTNTNKLKGRMAEKGYTMLSLSKKEKRRSPERSAHFRRSAVHEPHSQSQLKYNTKLLRSQGGNNMAEAIMTPAEVGEILGVNPHSIRIQAREDPDKLGFPVSVIGRRCYIPKAPFFRWLNGEEEK